MATCQLPHVQQMDRAVETSTTVISVHVLWWYALHSYLSRCTVYRLQDSTVCTSMYVYSTKSK